MANAIKNSGLSTSHIECSSFTVTKTTRTLPDSSTVLFLSVTFGADSAVPFTLLKLYTANLKGTLRLSNLISMLNFYFQARPISPPA